MENQNTIKRLIQEWEKYGNLIVAYDFDNTVYDYHDEGHSYKQVIELLRECKEVGSYLMVYTAREDEELEFVRNYLNQNDIPFDSINETPNYITFKGKKLYYNILLDDRAGLSSAYHCLKETVNYMKENKEISSGGENV